MNELYKFTLNMNGINDYDYNSTGQCVSDSKRKRWYVHIIFKCRSEISGKKIAERIERNKIMRLMIFE